MFTGLKGRRVIVNLGDGGGSLRGEVARVGLFYVRLSGAEYLGNGGEHSIGSVRIARRAVLWLQEL